MNLKYFLTSLAVFLIISIHANSITTSDKNEKKISSADSIKNSINYLNKFLSQGSVWKTDNPEIARTIKGLVVYAENDRIDTVMTRIQKYQKIHEFRYFNRSHHLVKDSILLTGYLPHQSILEKMKQLDRAIWNGVDMSTIPLTDELINLKNNAKSKIAKGDEKSILQLTGLVLPDSLKNLKSIPDSLVKNSAAFNRFRNLEEQREKLLENARIKYNKSIQKTNIDSIITAYKHLAIREYSDSLQKKLRDSLKLKNENILISYNDRIVRMVNDTISKYIRTLQKYASNDSLALTIHTLTGNPVKLYLKNNTSFSNRMFIKNEQNDSLGIKMVNIDKNSFRIAIEDNVTFNRFAERQRRDYVFEKQTPDQKLTKIPKKYNVTAPWLIGGNGNFGITQTYLNNWKKGGRSAFSSLMVLKGYANYTDNKLKWENSGELRNGWIRQGGDLNQTQKNDDKIELISRLGISAFKKWYYSSEIDFETQFFNGYNYPNKTTAISSFLSPAKTLVKFGLDYKPNKNFSLFLSPLTSKTVFVRDTGKINQTRYGIPADSRSLWEPGLNADLKYKMDITPQISYETKYKMFLNYLEPFQKVDVSWENTIVAQLTERINMTFLLFLLYDDNVTFPTGKMDEKGKEIYKAKWQTKELITVGFSYKINKQYYKQKRIN